MPGRHFEIDIVHVLFELGDLFGGDLQPEFGFRFRKRDPQASPGAELALRN